MNRKKKIIFFGDSITQYGVFPGGYIDLLNKKISLQNLQDRNELIGSGIGGNKVYDLYLRMDEDVLNRKPDVVVIWVGVNDVWHQLSTGTGTDADKFEKFYTAILTKLLSRQIKLILVTPAVIGERYDNTNSMDGDLDKYSAIVKQLTKQYQCTLCDIRSVFLEYEKANNKENSASGILTTDGVHLNAKGNELAAKSLFDILFAK